MVWKRGDTTEKSKPFADIIMQTDVDVEVSIAFNKLSVFFKEK